MTVRAEPNSDPGHAPAQKPHLLYIADHGVILRLNRTIWNTAVALTAEGFRVSLVTDDPDAARALNGTPVACYTVRALTGLRAWRLAAWLEETVDPPPNLVHFWGTSAWPSLNTWLQRAGYPILLHMTGLADVLHLSPKELSDRIHIAAGCDGLRRAWVHRKIGGRSDCSVFPPVFFMPDEKPGLPDRTDRTLGVVWCGRFEETAGLDTLIDAAAALRRRNCDVHIALVGAGPRLRQTWLRIRSAKLLDMFSVVEAPRYWRRAVFGADVCVVPAPDMSLSLAPLYAMALGRIVLAARGQIADWFVEAETAILFSPEDATELANLIEQAACDDSELRELSSRATQYVQHRHSVSGCVSRLEALYHRMLAPIGPSSSS